MFATVPHQQQEPMDRNGGICCVLLLIHCLWPDLLHRKCAGNRFPAIGSTISVRALEHNPQLLALREQHGIAAAGVVIAKTYPFNPIYQGAFRDARTRTAQFGGQSILQRHQSH